MSTIPRTPRGTVIVGYILPPRQETQRNQDEGSDEDDEEEEEDPEFLDMGEMESLSAGGRMFQSSVTPRLEGKILALVKMHVIAVLSAMKDLSEEPSLINIQ